MSMNDVIDTLHDFLVKWLTDAGFRQQYGGNLEYALHENDFDDVDADTLKACLPLVAEELPLSYQESIYEYLNAESNVDSGGYFEVNQGGGGATGTQGAGGNHEGGESDLDEVVRHIYNIQNVSETNYSYIDDSGDVSTTITALGDVDFDQNVATNGGVAAGGDVEGVNTGTNSGIVAGGDVEDAEVSNVTGDGNVTGKVDSGANVVTGNAGVAAASGAYVATEDVNVGGTQYNIDADDGSAVNFGSGSAGVDNSVDNSVDYDDSFNEDNSVHTDVDVKIKDSFQDNSDNSDHSTTDNSTNTDVDVKIKDSFQDNDDNSVNTDTDVDVKDSFQDNDDLSRYTEVDIEDSFQDNDTAVSKSYTETNTDIDADVDIDYTEDNDGVDVDSKIDDIHV